SALSKTAGSHRRWWAHTTQAGPGKGAAHVPRQAVRRGSVGAQGWPSRPCIGEPGPPRGCLARTALTPGSASAAEARTSAADTPVATRSSVWYRTGVGTPIGAGGAPEAAG